MVYFLLNDISLSGKMKRAVARAKAQYAGFEITCLKVTDVNYKQLMTSLQPEDQVVLFGGDGTLNYFVNAIAGTHVTNPVFACKSGTGNDFLRDVMNEKAKDGTLYQINKYLDNLPKTMINGKTYLFFNNVSFGMDGEVCTIADDQKIHGHKKTNYTLIAAKLLLKYKPTDAEIIVDGKSYSYKNVWMAPAMNGRFFGGGMKVTPFQDRDSDVLTLCVFSCKHRLQTMLTFPLIFKGWHVKSKNHFFMFTGKEITVRFNVKRDMQIDGEVIRDVLEYKAIK